MRVKKETIIEKIIAIQDGLMLFPSTSVWTRDQVIRLLTDLSTNIAKIEE